MIDTARLLFSFFLRILPGIVIIVSIFLLLKPHGNFRILLYIFAFVLFRDTMTPMGLWSLGSNNGWIWIRLSDDPIFLIAFGLFSLLIVLGLSYFDRENRRHLIWFKENKFLGIIIGILGCLAVILPFFIAYRFIDIDVRGGLVSLSLVLPILIFALFGNLFEETLFRGYVIGILDASKGLLYKGLVSGLIFAFCHIFLASTVTNIGVPLLLFTLWEGSIAGIVGVKYGIIPATLTHGGAVFLLSSGLF